MVTYGLVETISMGITRQLLLTSDRLALFSTQSLMADITGGLLVEITFELIDHSPMVGVLKRQDFLPTVPQSDFLRILTQTAQSASEN